MLNSWMRLEPLRQCSTVIFDIVDPGLNKNASVCVIRLIELAVCLDTEPDHWRSTGVLDHFEVVVVQARGISTCRTAVLGHSDMPLGDFVVATAVRVYS